MARVGRRQAPGVEPREECAGNIALMFERFGECGMGFGHVGTKLDQFLVELGRFLPCAVEHQAVCEMLGIPEGYCFTRPIVALP